MAELPTREIPRELGIEHAFWEADRCVANHAFCAAVAMLRRALDIWSKIQRDKFAFVFEKGERDDLYGRLKKVETQNPLYANTIHKIMDGLRVDGNEVLHDSVTCDVSEGGSALFPNRFADRKRAYDELSGAVRSLVRSTLPKRGH